MNYRLILFCISCFSVFVGVAEAISALACWALDPRDVCVMLICGLATAAVGAAGIFRLKPKTEEQRKAGLREGYAIAGLGWIVASILGALPFFFATKMQWYDALFESASGFTTTGVALIHAADKELPGYILRNGEMLKNGVESLSKSIVLWRSLESWFGGIGIVVLMAAFLPKFSRGIQKLYNAETPGLKSSDTQIAPSTKKSAIILSVLYLGITVAETILLKLAGMDLFEAVCNSFTTVSTGGFCTRQASIAAFDSTPITLIVTFFMFISGVNFFLHVRLFSGKPLSYRKDEEFCVYTGIIVIVSLVIAFFLLKQGVETVDPASGEKEILYLFDRSNGIRAALTRSENYRNVLLALRDAMFQTTSIMTSTGFSIGNYCTWPNIAIALIVGISVIGGCGGSTAGGLKCVRALLVFRQSKAEVKHSIFPQLVTSVKLNDVRVKAPAIQKAVAFFIAYIGIIIIFALLIPLVCSKCEWETGLSASITCLSNVGPGVGQIGPAADFDWLNPTAKLLLSLEMIIGRLELFTILVLFQRDFWRK